MMFSWFREKIKWSKFERRLHSEMEHYHGVEDPWDSHLYSKELACEIQTLIRNKINIDVLDIGVGDGLVLRDLNIQAREMTVIDISQKALDKAKKNLVHITCPINFKRENIFTSTFKSEYYDLIILSYLVDYLGFNQFPKKIASLFLNISKSLKKEGQIIIISPAVSDDYKSLHQQYLFIFKQFGIILETEKLHINYDHRVIIYSMRKK